MTTAQLGDVVFSHRTEEIVGVQGEDRIRIMESDGEWEYGDLPLDCKDSDFDVACNFILRGRKLGRLQGEYEAKSKMRKAWQSFKMSIE